MQTVNPKLDVGLALAILALWAGYGTINWWNEWPFDLSALWMAGRLWDLGDIGHLYDAPTRVFARDFTERWTELVAETGHGDKVALPFVYPPIWAWLLSHFGQVDPMVFFNTGRVFLFAAMAGAVFVLWRLAAPAYLSATTFALVTILIAEATIPYAFGARLAQPQLLLTLLMILSFERYAAGAKRTAAIALGVAAAIKITPIILVLAFIAERDWRTTAEAVAVAAGIAVLSFVVAGIDPHLAFLARIQEINGLAVMVGINVNFEAVMHMEFIPAETRAHFSHAYVGDDVAWVSVLEKIGLVVTLVLAYRSGQGFGLRDRLVIRLTTITLATLLFGPLSWMHYYMLPVMILPLLPIYLGWRRALIVALPVFSLMILPVHFTERGLILVERIYPEGYWLGFLWFFLLLATAKPLPAKSQTEPRGAPPSDLLSELAAPRGIKG